MPDLDSYPPLRDRIKPGVRVLFVGINPGVRSALSGHHFAGFSNRFWKLLFESKLVPEPLTFEDDDRLPEFNFGITNIVPRATPSISTLAPAEYVAGRLRLRRKVLRYKPPVIAMVGVTVFRAMFPERRDAVKLGPQPERVGDAEVFVLPNPSGRNANFTYAEMLAAFRALRRRIHRRSGVKETRWATRLRYQDRDRGGDLTHDVARSGTGVRPKVAYRHNMLQ